MSHETTHQEDVRRLASEVRKLTERRRRERRNRRGRLVSLYSGIAIFAISCAGLMGWNLHGRRADADLALEVRELEQFATKLCRLDLPFHANNPEDRFFLERAKECYAEMVRISARHDVDELTVARGHLRMGMILVACGLPDEGVHPLRTAWSTLVHFDRFPLLDEQNAAPDAPELAADCAAHLAAVLAARSQSAEAEELFGVAIRNYEAEARRKSGLARIAINLAGAGKTYGDMLMGQKRWKEAERSYLRAEHACAPLLRDRAVRPVADLLVTQLQAKRAAAHERLKDLAGTNVGV